MAAAEHRPRRDSCGGELPDDLGADEAGGAGDQHRTVVGHAPSRSRGLSALTLIFVACIERSDASSTMRPSRRGNSTAWNGLSPYQ